ncbi:MAG: RNA polymerase sigma factor [Planctomycetes bacterium]|nr:RNA polymerase sigma factor [Planctomycetota bacterium]MBL7037919.1 RNA polymerase sigma factor [Pirellulaceae bacterium]
MDKTSLSLLRRACEESDSDSWETLAALYTPLLQRWLQRYGLQPSDADDLVQDVLVAVAKDLPKFQHTGRSGAFRAWLRGIVANRIRNFWRQRNHRPVSEGGTEFIRSLEQLEDPNSGLSRLWCREHDVHLLQTLLSRIEGRFSPSTVSAFRRVVLDGVDSKKVATELGISPNAVVIAKCRVLKELRHEGDGLLGD